MKKLFSIISALLLTVTGYAQDGEVGEFTIQPMAGITATAAFNLSYEAFGEIENQTGIGFTIGADFGYRASEVFYPTVGLHVIQSVTGFELGHHDGDITATNFAIPVLANFNVSDIRLGIGIQPMFNLGKSTSNNLSDVKDAIKKNTIAVPIVVGYELSNGLTLEFRAAYDVTKSVDYKSSAAKLSTNNLTGMATIGYKFKM